MPKKLLCDGWKDKKYRVCIYCGKPYAERHEVFQGINRQISIREKFQVDVCRLHHSVLQDNIIPWAQEENLRLKQEFERNWLDKLMETGISEKEAVRAWMKMIGRNYLDEIIPE